MSNQTDKTAAYVSTLGLLGIAFVVLKLTKVINWSWWLVTMPFWGPVGLILGIMILVILFHLIRYLITGK